MTLATFRYQIVYRVIDKAGAPIMHGDTVLPAGATPPEFHPGDAWRVELANGSFIEGIVYVANRKLIFTDPHNWLVQYDFSIREN